MMTNICFKKRLEISGDRNVAWKQFPLKNSIPEFLGSSRGVAWSLTQQLLHLGLQKAVEFTGLKSAEAD